MSKSTKKRRDSENAEEMKRVVSDRKRERIIYGFITVFGILVLLGVATIILGILFTTNLYHAFIYDWVGTAFLYMGGMTLLLYFIYCCLVITIKNPQKVRKSQVVAFGGAGIIFIVLCVMIFQEFSSLTMNSIRDMNDYSNGVMKIEELKVVEIYEGIYSIFAKIYHLFIF
ncbi:hypothetical protein MKZ25_10410 [Solibacillus sp. FSL W7-1464]|uniref:hypothetical protein n=1 Tax=Solibacillus sp. FSL W7-1464 TaxID=2921706 RepID=UPI0030F4FEBD